jgi:glucokinase
MVHVIGVDVGGTKIEAILFDGKKVLKSVRVPAQADKPYKIVLKTVLDVINQVRSPQTAAIGLATPGYIHNGKIHNAPNNPSLNGRPIAADVQKELKLPVVHENDAKCFAFAEARVGAGKGKQHIIGVIVGTGVGGGLVLNGKLYRGAIGAAGEIGHMPYLDSEYEAYAAGPAIASAYKKAGGVRALSAGDILRYVKSQNKKEHEAIVTAQKGCYEALARLSASLINTFNPEVIVYGGGVSKSIDYKRLRKETAKYALSEPFAVCKQLKHTISDSAGSMGAAQLALESVR